MGSEVARERFELPASIPDGARNDTLFSYGRSLRARGAGDDEITEALLAANSERCVPPLPGREVRATARSVCSVQPGLSPEYEAMRRSVLSKSERDSGAGYAPPAVSRGDALLVTAEAVNDKDLSRVFADEYGGVARYVPEARGWYAYDGARWRDARSGGEQIAQRLMKAFVNRLWAGMARIADNSQRSEFNKRIGRYLMQPGRRNLLADCQSEMVAHVGDFDADGRLLNCQNGTLDLATGEFRAHDPADMLTKMCGCPYDGGAKYDEWAMFVLDTMGGDDALATFLKTCVGAALAGDTTDERFYIAYGPTRTGKSTTLDTILSMFGDYGATIQPETLQETRRNARSASPDVAKLVGVRFLVCPEPPKDMQLDASLVKQWTGGDLVAARHVYGDEFMFRPRFQLWMNTNYLPGVRDSTLFESGRVVPVPFERRLGEGERDLTLKDSMREPGYLSGVLRWALDGWQVRSTFGAPIPDRCSELARSYAGESDRIGTFVSECCETGEGNVASSKQLVDAYREWCQANGYKPLGRDSLIRELQRRGLIKPVGRVRRGGVDVKNGFAGLGVR